MQWSAICSTSLIHTECQGDFPQRGAAKEIGYNIREMRHDAITLQKQYTTDYLTVIGLGQPINGRAKRLFKFVLRRHRSVTETSDEKGE